jgi:Flp pilus assembly protein TadG
MNPQTFRRSKRGAAQIEFVLTIFIVLFVMWGLIEISMAVYTMVVLGDAAKEGVRYAIVHGVNNTGCSGPVDPARSNPSCTSPDTSGANIVAVVRDYAQYSLHNTSTLPVVVTYPDSNNNPLSRVQVSVTYNYVPWINLPGTTPTLRAYAEGRIVH